MSAEELLSQTDQYETRILRDTNVVGQVGPDGEFVWTSGSVEPAVTLTTYKRADGEPVWGEYAWVTDEEFFDDLDEPIAVVKEVWMRQSVETVTFKPAWDEPEVME